MNRTMKKLLSVMLSVFMIAGLIPLITPPEADAATSTWDGSVTTSFSGAGTAASPYIIDTAAKLAGVARLTNANNGWSGGKYFVQTVDIDLNNREWTPIGIQRQNGGSATYSEANAWFRGYYDGNGHVVKNVRVGTSSSRSSVKHVGLFGIIGSAAQIYNLGVETASYYINHYCDDERVGGFVGYCAGVIQGCYARNVTINQSGVCVIGGFCGQATGSSTIYKSYAYNVSLTQGSGRKGGFVGDGDGTVAFSFVNYYPFKSDNSDGSFTYAYGETSVTGTIFGNGGDTGYGPESFMSGGSNGGWPQLIWQACGPLDYNATDGYMITTAAQMRSLACFVNNGRSYSGAKIALKADIDLSAYDWAPIGINHSYRDRFFSGTFNGNGHIISNLKIGTSSNRNTYYTYKGLFGYTNNATINCVGINNAQIYGNGPSDYRCGALVGQADGGSGKIYQCFVKNSTVNMSGTGVSGVIVGDVRHNITDCYTLNSSATGTRAGSVVGDMKSTAYNLYSGANCSSTTNSYTSENKGTPVNCYHKASASASAGYVSTFNGYANRTNYWKSSGAWMTDIYNINGGYACLKWEPRFSIAFNGNGGTVSGTTPITGRYQYTATTPSASRTGYDFKGYFQATSGGSSVIGGSATYTFGTTVPSNTAQTGTLYAQWTAHTYTVTYNGNGNTGGATASSSHTYDVAKALTDNGFSRAYTVTYNHNYSGSSNTSATATATFNGWATSATGAKVYNNSQSVTNLTATNGATVPLYANWTLASVTLPTPTRTGYTFGGWYGETGCTTKIGDGGASYTPTGNKTLFAKWTPITYTVSYNGNGATSGTTASSTHTYDTAKALTTNGFSRVYTVSYNYQYRDINDQPVTGSATATAAFNGWATSASGAKVYNNGQSVTNLRSTAGTFPLFANWTLTSVTLPNPTRDGYQFGGWFTNDACTQGQQNGGASVTPTANVTYFAKWTPNTFKVHFNGNGATSGQMADQNFTYDTPQNLTKNTFKKEYTVTFNHKGGSGTANATAAASFNGWALSADGTHIYGDQEQVGNLSAVNNDTANLFAKWKAMGSVTLPTSSKEGCTFEGWYSDAELTNKVGNAGAAYTPAENGVTLYAKHTTNTYTITFKSENGTLLDTKTVAHGETPVAPAIPAKAPTATQHFTGAWDKPIVAATETTTYTVVYTGADHTGGEATCIAQAVCGVCGTSYGELGTTNHKHTHTDDAVTANCITEGFTAGIFCDDCKHYVSGHESQGYDVSENGHSYGGWSSNGNDTHTKTCSRCTTETTNHTVTTDCHGGTATCLALAVCDDCGETYGDYASHQLEEVPAQAPSCLDPGHVAFWHCSVCNKNFTDNTGTTEITSYQNEHTPAAAVKENDVPSTCSTLGGYDAVVYCSVCGKRLAENHIDYTEYDPTNHTGNNTESKANELAATCMAGGHYDKVLTCECGVEVGRETINTKVDPTNHTGHNTESKANELAATCMEGGHYDKVLTCECGVEVGRETINTEVDPTNHTGHNTESKANELAATCMEGGHYDKVLTCECGVEVGRETINTEIDPTNHTGHNTESKANELAATCMEGGHYDKVLTCECGVVVGRETINTEVDPTNHTGHNTESKANELAATCMAGGHYDKVLTCECGVEVGRETINTEVDPTNHTGNNTESTENELAATCMAGGHYDKVLTCECGVEVGRETINTEVDPSNHTGNNTESTENELAATCMAGGHYDKVLTCECGVEVGRETITTEVDPTNHTGHNTESTENELAATCMAGGHYDKVLTCECGVVVGRETINTEIDPDNHTGNNTETTENELAATCMEGGHYDKVLTCECGVVVGRETINTEIDPDNHTGNNTETTENELAATCMAGGHYDKVLTCECGVVVGRETINTEIDPNNHTGNNTTFKEDVIAATCTAEGSYTEVVKCECGVSLSRTPKTTEKLPHNLAYTEAVPATCKNTGFAAYWYCDACEQYFLTEDVTSPLSREELNEQAVIEKTDTHTPGEAVKENEVAATCTTDGSYDMAVYCTVCGNEISREPHVVPAGHTAGEIVKENESAPTCTETGSYDAVVYCTECGEEMSRDTVTVPANGHTWGEWEVVTPATEEADGEAKRVCSVCGAEETKPISAMGDEITKTVKFVNIGKMHYEIDLGDGETYEIYNSSTVQWISRQALRFKVVTYAGYNYDDIIIRANGTEITPNADGYYSLPKTAETVIVTAEGAVKDDSAPSGKLSFWELLIRFFKKIVAFFSSAFGKK